MAVAEPGSVGRSPQRKVFVAVHPRGTSGLGRDPVPVDDKQKRDENHAPQGREDHVESVDEQQPERGEEAQEWEHAYTFHLEQDPDDDCAASEASR